MSSAVAAPIHSARFVTFARDGDGPADLELDSEHESVAALLAEHDIVVNCMLQDTDAPLIFVTNEELSLSSTARLFVDVSCDEGMGFEWARPTSFADPMFTVGDGLTYYAVDHSPILLVGLRHLGDQPGPAAPSADHLVGPEAWEADTTISRAIEIRDGVIQNPKILSFQGRSAEFPHERL